MMVLNKCSAIAVLLGAVLFVTAARAQVVTKESLYNLDIVRSGERAATTKSVANYWFEAGLREIQKLRSRKRGQFGFQAEKLDKLETLYEEYQSLKVHKPDGSIDREASKLRRAFFDSDRVAQQVFDILGPEHGMQVVLERNIYHLQMLKERASLQDIGELQTVFSLPLFRKALQVEGEQTKEVEAVNKSCKEDYRSAVKMQMDALRNASQDRWHALLAQLNATQRGRAVRMMGEPVEWYRIEKQPEFRRHGVRPDGTANYGGGWNSGSIRELAKKMARGNERWFIDAPNEEFEKLGYTCMDLLAYQMLFEKLLWDEMEFTQEQRKSLALKGKFRRKLHVESKIVARPSGVQRFESLLDGKAKYPPEYHEFFLPDQLTWFRQIETQIRAGQKYDSSVGLLHPTIANYLELTGSQKIVMQKIAREFEERVRLIVEKIVAERQMAQHRLLERVFKILDPAQRKKFESLTGKKILE